MSIEQLIVHLEFYENLHDKCGIMACALSALK